MSGGDAKIYNLSVRVDQTGGGPVAARVNDPDELKTSNAHHILLLVHGFNNSPRDAKKSYAAQTKILARVLKGRRVAPDAIALFQWPGDLQVLLGGAVFNAVGYPGDINQALQAADRMAAYLSELAANSGTPELKVTFIGHSLGCRLILEALQRAKRPIPRIEVISLMAGAVGTQLVAPGGALNGIVAFARRVLKFFSERDLVLRFAFPAGQLAASSAGIEPRYYAEAIGLHGNPTSFGNTFARPNTHGQYWGDEDAAGIFARELDPTLPIRPEPPRQMAGRAMPQASALEGRELASRNLPQ